MGHFIVVWGMMPLLMYASHQKEKQRLTMEKTRRLRAMALEENASTIYNNIKEGVDLNVYEVTALLSWHKVKTLDKMSKEEKFEAREKIV